MEQLEAAYARVLCKTWIDAWNCLKVAVSPTTVGFTAFSIVGREGLEAVVILAALLAGLRGRAARGKPGKGFGLAPGWPVFVTIITFWLSRTVIQSLEPVWGKAGSGGFDSRGDDPPDRHELGLSSILLDRLERQTSFPLQGGPERAIVAIGKAWRCWGSDF